jgi:hypothetical protein
VKILVFFCLHFRRMTSIEKQHEVVKKSLFQFIKKEIPGADLRNIDEIVLSYVISILEEASDDPCFDVEGILHYFGH